MVALLLDENETNDDGEDKGERKKNNMFFKQNNTFARASRSFSHLFPIVMHHYDMKTANFPHSLYGVSEHKTEIVFLFF